MATFTLPDKGPLAGKQLNIPDDLNQRQQIAGAIQQIPEYGPEVAKEYLEGTLGGQALEFGKNIPRQAATSTISTVRGLADLAAQDSLGLDGPAIKLRDKLKQIEENVYENVGGEIDPRYADKFIPKAGGALGSWYRVIYQGANKVWVTGLGLVTGSSATLPSAACSTTTGVDG